MIFRLLSLLLISRLEARKLVKDVTPSLLETVIELPEQLRSEKRVDFLSDFFSELFFLFASIRDIRDTNSILRFTGFWQFEKGSLNDSKKKRKCFSFLFFPNLTLRCSKITYSVLCKSIPFDWCCVLSEDIAIGCQNNKILFIQTRFVILTISDETKKRFSLLST